MNTTTDKPDEDPRAYRRWLTRQGLTLPDALPGKRYTRSLFEDVTATLVAIAGAVFAAAVVALVLWQLGSLASAGKPPQYWQYGAFADYYVGYAFAHYPIVTFIVSLAMIGAFRITASIVRATLWFARRSRVDLLARYVAYDFPGYREGQSMNSTVHALYTDKGFAAAHRTHRRRFLKRSHAALVKNEQQIDDGLPVAVFGRPPDVEAK
jgi:hypothetical protein